MSDTTTLTDTATWLPLNGLEPGFDENKAAPVTDLDGQTITISDSRGTRIEHRFTTGQVSWQYTPGTDDPLEAHSGEDPCEVFAVDEDLYYAQFAHRSRPNESVSLVLDLHSGHALAVISVLGEASTGSTAVTQHFQAAQIDGHDLTGTAPAPTTELIGRRVLWVYSHQHAYEHVYLSPLWYTWQCLAGPERGLADTDQNTVWRLRPGIYLFAWREKVIPCGSVTIADHRDARSLRSHGALFGADDHDQPTHFTFGAHGRLLSTTVHPEPYDPSTAPRP